MEVAEADKHLSDLLHGHAIGLSRMMPSEEVRWIFSCGRRWRCNPIRFEIEKKPEC